MSSICAIGLAAPLLAGCGASSGAPVDVEGTVQARVSATVAAGTQAQSAATRQPNATPGNATTAASVTPPPGDARSAGSAGSAGLAGTATPPAAATGVPTAAGGGTPVGTTTEALSLGTFARLGGLSVTVRRYEWGFTCPSGGGRPAQGAKFTTLWATARNDTGNAVALPALQWTVGGFSQTPGGQPCESNDQAFVADCYRTVQLAAGAHCEGWVLFEVPEAMEVPGAPVQVRAAGVAAPVTVQWRLPT